MTTDDIKELLINSDLIECNDRLGHYYQSKLFIAYNDHEAWTFHLTRCRAKDLFTATKVLPYFVAMIKFDEVPSYVMEMHLDWGDNICAKYGDVTNAMKALKNSEQKYDNISI